MMGTVVLFGCREDGTVPFVKAFADIDHREALREAAIFLAENNGYSAVELWAENCLIGKVTPRLDLTPMSTDDPPLSSSTQIPA